MGRNEQALPQGPELFPRSCMPRYGWQDCWQPPECERRPGPGPHLRRSESDTHSVVNFQSTESQLMSKGDAETKDDSEETVPNPFSQLTDQELEEYKKEVERKKLELDGK